MQDRETETEMASQIDYWEKSNQRRLKVRGVRACVHVWVYKKCVQVSDTLFRVEMSGS